MFGEQLCGVFSSVSLSERWRLIISYLTAQWIAASLLTLLCQVNVPFFKWWREGRGAGGLGSTVDSEMMIINLTLCCCWPERETRRRNKEISLHTILRRSSSGAGSVYGSIAAAGRFKFALNIFTSGKMFLWEFKSKDAEQEAFELLQPMLPLRYIRLAKWASRCLVPGALKREQGASFPWTGAKCQHLRWRAEALEK